MMRVFRDYVLHSISCVAQDNSCSCAAQTRQQIVRAEKFYFRKLACGGVGAATVTGTPGQENLLAQDKKEVPPEQDLVLMSRFLGVHIPRV